MMKAQLRAASAASVIAMISVPAHAEEPPPSSVVQASGAERSAIGTVAEAHGRDAGDASQSEITVTGTRVARKGYDAPVPTTTLTADDLHRSGNSSLMDTLQELPQIVGGHNLTSAPNSSNFAGQTNVALRGLGAIRTLVLVDGERLMPGAIYGQANISLIPQALIKRVEVVTGGASAQWGSDALAGVVNLIIDQDFEGIRGSFQGGVTSHGDYSNYLAAIAWGHRFAGGRGRVQLAVEIAGNEGVGSNSRDWLGPSFIPNPNATAANKSESNPLNILAYDAMLSNATFGGLVTTGPLRGTAFGPNGATYQFNYGSLVSPTLMAGGGEVSRAAIVRVAAPLSRQVGYGSISFDLTDDVQIHAGVRYAHSESVGPLTLPGSNADTSTIRVDNAFLPETVRAQMVANGLATISVTRFSTDYALNTIRLPTDTGQVGGGLKGSFGGEGVLKDWLWDIRYSYGWTNSPIEVINNRNTQNYANAVDSILLNGQPVCRSVTARAAGCQPINIFGRGAPATTPGALGYVLGTSLKTFYIDRHNVAGTLKGTLFSTWAGPVSFAGGLEWRRDSVDISSDPISAAAGWGVSGQVPFSGSVSVGEGFAEVVVPLISGQSWTKSLDINGAVRVANYSTSGTTTVWKAGASWTINDSVRLRATRSRDFRGPALTQLFEGGSSLNATITDPQLNQQYVIYAPRSGNPLLGPEMANTTAVGVVLTPNFVPGLRLSVDWYDIRLKGLIVSSNAQLAINNCYNFNLDCATIIRGADGRITQAPSTYVNLQSAHASGVDFEAEYRSGLHSWGRLTLRAMGTYAHTATSDQIGGTFTRYDGLLTHTNVSDGLSGGPKWRVTTGATWSNGPMDLSVTQRFVGGGRIVGYEFTAADYDTLTVNGRSYTDLNLQYRIESGGDRRSATAFFGVRNLFDRDPPITGTGGLGQVPTEAAVYDVLGRQFMAGIRFSY